MRLFCWQRAQHAFLWVGSAQDRQETAAANTYAAEALIARVTIQAGQTAAAQLTQISQQEALLQTQTSQASVPTAQPLSETLTSPPPSPSPIPPTPSPTSIAAPCSQAAIISDLGLPSGTQLLAGSSTSKGWRLLNTGSCTWTSGYSLVYTGGNLPNPPQAVFLQTSVSPGASADLEMLIQSPGYSGTFQALFLLRDEAGATFGTGTGANTPLEFRFSTTQSSNNSGSTFDIAANFCTADWTSAFGRLPCPGSSPDTRGSVQLVQSPLVEGALLSGHGLWTRPDSSGSGYINGLFSSFLVQSGDTFRSEIGCLQDSPGCSLTFRLEYQASDGQSGTFGVWNEDSDGRTTPIEIDLSSLTGRNIRLNLQVINRGAWQAADGYWHQPRIQRFTASSDLVLTWNRSTSSQSGHCREMRIRLTGFGSGTAQALSCRDESRDLGTRGLSADEVLQVQSWVQRFGAVEVEMYTAAQADPTIIWVKLDGIGGGSANEADIRAIDSFCSTIYSSIIR